LWQLTPPPHGSALGCSWMEHSQHTRRPRVRYRRSPGRRPKTDASGVGRLGTVARRGRRGTVPGLVSRRTGRDLRLGMPHSVLRLESIPLRTAAPGSVLLLDCSPGCPFSHRWVPVSSKRASRDLIASELAHRLAPSRLACDSISASSLEWVAPFPCGRAITVGLSPSRELDFPKMAFPKSFPTQVFSERPE
jgi:hypothetical protein